MTYWDWVVTIVTALISPAAVALYILISIFGALGTLLAAIFERGFWSTKRPYRWRKPTWCRVVFVAVGPYILLAISAMFWIGSFPSGQVWP